ncbi:MAG: HAD-IA family hydrolase [Candidatus Margulisbacteria bacterium]|nr:HAD-IA family hydrolase [Candidatus Margulisiibacteriota bacterium]
MINTLIFDLDGTLVDTSGDITDAANYSLEKNGFPAITQKTCIRLIGDGLDQFLMEVTNKKGNLQQLRASYLYYYSQNLVNKTKPYPGIKELLSWLKEKGLTLAILTNKREDLSLEILECHDMVGYFDIVAGEDTYHVRKPDPKGLLTLMDQLGGDKDTTLFVGDGDTDIKVSQNGGIKVIAVTYGYRARDELSKLNPDYIVDSVSDIKTAIKTFS